MPEKVKKEFHRFTIINKKIVRDDKLKMEDRIIMQVEMIRHKLVETIAEIDRAVIYLERVKMLRK